MTNEEAIEVVKEQIDDNYSYKNMKEWEILICKALKMSIESLKQPQIIYCKDCWYSSEEKFGVYCNMFNMYDIGYCGLGKIEE